MDHYLPGHTAGSRGDLDEAIHAYQAALTLQPDNYNAMFFLGRRLASQKQRHCTHERLSMAEFAEFRRRQAPSDCQWQSLSMSSKDETTHNLAV